LYTETVSAARTPRATRGQTNSQYEGWLVGFMVFKATLSGQFC